MSAKTETYPITFAGLKKPRSVPNWAKIYNPRRITIEELCNESIEAGVTVLKSKRPKTLLQFGDLYKKLFIHLLNASDSRTRIILSFEAVKEQETDSLTEILRLKPEITSRVELSLSPEDLKRSIVEAITKLNAISYNLDPLSKIKQVAATSRPLQSDNGRLSAKAIAELYGFSLSELARQIRRTKQSIAKTPDAESLQKQLRPYERIARLRTVMSDSDFRGWLNRPNANLENEMAPIDYLKSNASEQLADFAENMLTGAPS